MNYCKDCKTRFMSQSGRCPLCKKEGVKFDDSV